MMPHLLRQERCPVHKAPSLVEIAERKAAADGVAIWHHFPRTRDLLQRFDTLLVCEESRNSVGAQAAPNKRLEGLRTQQDLHHILVEWNSYMCVDFQPIEDGNEAIRLVK